MNQVTPPPGQEASPPSAGVRPREVAVEFSGAGHEYFRIWAVNLLLVVLTFGLFLPFAKARRLRYLYANTWVDGDALMFTGNPWRMFRGFVLMVMLAAVYLLASHLSPWAGLVALFLVYALWPALWRAGMQFRLGNLCWRGLTGRFRGSLAGAYLAFLPVSLPLGLSAWVEAVGGAGGPSEDPGLNQWAWAQGVIVLLLLAVPWSLTLIRRYQHRGYSLADQDCRIDLHGRAVYFVGLKCLMLALFGTLAVLMVGFLVGSLITLALTGQLSGPVMTHYIGLSVFGLMAVLNGVVLMPYWATRMQNLTWAATRAPGLRFGSELDGWVLVWLAAKSWALIILTLGLYRPYAVIAITRARLQAMRVTFITEPATWCGRTQGAAVEATGEVAGDFFGMDVGW